MQPHCAVVAARATRSLFARSKFAFVDAVVAVIIGIAGGVLSFLFLESLDWAGSTREKFDWLVVLLPIGGLIVGLLYHRFGQPIAGGTSLVLDAVHVPDGEVPTRMAPMIWAGSVGSHLVGASVGREGAIVQIVSSVTDDIARRLRRPHLERRIFIVAAISAAFGGLFGVPFGGAAFSLEAQRRSRLHLSAVIPALIAGVVGDRVARALGVGHETSMSITSISFGWSALWRYLLAAIVFGAVAAAFIHFEHFIKRSFARGISWPPLRPMVGGFVVLGLVLIANDRAYLGISTDLVVVSLAGGAGLAAIAFVWKFVFTAVSLGSGFVGGEVFPLFVIGALTGVQFARITNSSVPLFAALGLIAVFAAASDTPIASTIIGIELFGWTALPVYIVVCFVAEVVSGDQTIYPASPLRKSTQNH